ncbi:MAG: 2OG-Fe(II) oxygenase [Pseudomonadota bacterium]
MKDLIALEKYPLDRLDSPQGSALLDRCKHDLAEKGMFTLKGFMRPGIIDEILPPLYPMFERESFTHEREHKIYFDDNLTDVDRNHPALKRVKTINHTLCGDQLPEAVSRIYFWSGMTDFLARVMQKEALFPMDDPLACANVMGYYAGEGLNWHFDRSEFTTTLLLQPPEVGGQFEYRRELRSDADPNLSGIARLLRGEDPEVSRLDLGPGDLNVFKGKNTAHRVTPPVGDKMRIISVFSYYETPGRIFSDEENIGFYGRTAKQPPPVS